MTTVKLGSNDFIDVQVLIAHGGRTLLSVSDNPLRLTLSIPESAPAFAPRLEVLDNEARQDDPKLKISTTDDAVTILYNSNPICVATRIGPGIIVLRVDLRPVGVLVHDDALGLHIGGSTFARNTLQKLHTAINLA